MFCYLTFVCSTALISAAVQSAFLSGGGILSMQNQVNQNHPAQCQKHIPRGYY